MTIEISKQKTKMFEFRLFIQSLYSLGENPSSITYYDNILFSFIFFFNLENRDSIYVESLICKFFKIFIFYFFTFAAIMPLNGHQVSYILRKRTHEKDIANARISVNPLILEFNVEVVYVFLKVIRKIMLKKVPLVACHEKKHLTVYSGAVFGVGLMSTNC